MELAENLTIPQLKAQQYIQNYYKDKNKAPSYRDIQLGLGYSVRVHETLLIYKKMEAV